jgi:hypothetical protein
VRSLFSTLHFLISIQDAVFLTGNSKKEWEDLFSFGGSDSGLFGKCFPHLGLINSRW